MSEAQTELLPPGPKKNGKLAKRERTEIAPPQPVTPMGLLDRALANQAGIDIIERLAALQEKAINREAEAEFNRAMSAAQAEIGRIAPDLFNPQTKSRYASYATIDRVLRPIYTKHGFALSFDEGDSPATGMVRVLCYVSHSAGHTRTYRKDMPMPINGPQGKPVMTETHGSAAADSYGMRYILRKIFNVAIGEDDTDGNPLTASDFPEIDKILKAIAEAPDMSATKKEFGEAYRKVKLAKNDAAELAIIAAYDKRKAELTATEAA